MKGKPGEDTERRWPSTSQGERPQKAPTCRHLELGLVASILWENNFLLFKAVVPNLFGTRDWFHVRVFLRTRVAGGDAFRMIQAHYIYFAFYFYYYIVIYRVFPGVTSGKESACQCRRYKRCSFDPWVGKIPWRRKWQRTAVFLPGESHVQKSLVDYSQWGSREMDTAEQLNMLPYSMYDEIII